MGYLIFKQGINEFQKIADEIDKELVEDGVALSQDQSNWVLITAYLKKHFMTPEGADASFKNIYKTIAALRSELTWAKEPEKDKGFVEENARPKTHSEYENEAPDREKAKKDLAQQAERDYVDHILQEAYQVIINFNRPTHAKFYNGKDDLTDHHNKLLRQSRTPISVERAKEILSSMKTFSAGLP